MTAADFRRIAPEPGGGGRVLHRRIAGFSYRRQEICFAGLASRRVRNLMLRWSSRPAFVEEAPEIFLRFLAAGERWGTRNIGLAAASEDVLTGALRTAWKLRRDKNRKDKADKTAMWRSAAE